MKSIHILLAGMLLVQCAAYANAQDKAPAPPSRGEPPAQAYEDCKNRKAGDEIQHTTPEGKVAATCQESAKGLVARPNRPKNPPPSPAGK